jgi:hypothetical protein
MQMKQGRMCNILDYKGILPEKFSYTRAGKEVDFSSAGLFYSRSRKQG